MLHTHHYDVDDAIDAGEKRHPQLVILAHYPDAQDLRPESVASCWIFKAAPREGTPDFFRDLTARPWGTP